MINNSKTIELSYQRLFCNSFNIHQYAHHFESQYETIRFDFCVLVFLSIPQENTKIGKAKAEQFAKTSILE